MKILKSLLKKIKNMKKIIVLVSAVFFQSAFGQVSLSGNKIMKDGVKYKYSKYEKVFVNPEAQQYFKKTRTNKTVAQVLAYTGGFSIGMGIGDMIAQGKERTVPTIMGGSYIVKPNYSTAWTLIGTGVGLVGIGIPFAMGAAKNAEKAIQIENGEPVAFQPYFKLESAGNGVAMSYNF